VNAVQVIELLQLPAWLAGSGVLIWGTAKAVIAVRSSNGNGTGRNGSDEQESRGWTRAVLEALTASMRDQNTAINAIARELHDHGVREVAVWEQVLKSLEALQGEISRSSARL
jgi:hypothetical protein